MAVRVQWRRLRAGSGPGDTTADGRFEVWHSPDGTWAVWPGVRGPRAVPVFTAPTLRQCRRWVEEQYA